MLLVCAQIISGDLHLHAVAFGGKLISREETYFLLHTFLYLLDFKRSIGVIYFKTDFLKRHFLVEKDPGDPSSNLISATG